MHRIEADGPQDSRRGPYRGHRGPIAAAGGQRLELRLDVRHARRVPRAARPRSDAATPSPPSSATAASKKCRRRWSRCSARRRSTGWAMPAASSSWSKTAATSDWPTCRRPPTSSWPAATPRPAWRACSPACGPNTPWIYLDIDRIKAKQMGVGRRRRFRRPARLHGLALRQQLQRLRPLLAGQRPGRRPLPRHDRRGRCN